MLGLKTFAHDFVWKIKISHYKVGKRLSQCLAGQSTWVVHGKQVWPPFEVDDTGRYTVSFPSLGTACEQADFTHLFTTVNIYILFSFHVVFWVGNIHQAICYLIWPKAELSHVVVLFFPPDWLDCHLNNFLLQSEIGST